MMILKKKVLFEISSNPYEFLKMSIVQNCEENCQKFPVEVCDKPRSGFSEVERAPLVLYPVKAINTCYTPFCGESLPRTI